MSGRHGEGGKGWGRGNIVNGQVKGLARHDRGIPIAFVIFGREGRKEGWLNMEGVVMSNQPMPESSPALSAHVRYNSAQSAHVRHDSASHLRPPWAWIRCRSGRSDNPLHQFKPTFFHLDRVAARVLPPVRVQFGIFGS